MARKFEEVKNKYPKIPVEKVDISTVSKRQLPKIPLNTLFGLEWKVCSSMCFLCHDLLFTRIHCIAFLVLEVVDINHKRLQLLVLTTNC
jgi:hypothetical protein